MDILSQREISGFLSEKHVEEILSRRELINGCSIDKPYVQDGQVFRLKLENGLIMTITKDLIITLRELIRRGQNEPVNVYYPMFPLSGRPIYFVIDSWCGRYDCNYNYFVVPSGRYPEVNGERLVFLMESNDRNSFILKLEEQDEPVTVSKQLIKSLSDMMDPGPCFVRKLCTYLSNFIRGAFFGIF